MLSVKEVEDAVLSVPLTNQRLSWVRMCLLRLKGMWVFTGSKGRRTDRGNIMCKGPVAGDQCCWSRESQG